MHYFVVTASSSDVVDGVAQTEPRALKQSKRRYHLDSNRETLAVLTILRAADRIAAMSITPGHLQTRQTLPQGSLLVHDEMSDLCAECCMSSAHGRHAGPLKKLLGSSSHRNIMNVSCRVLGDRGDRLDRVLSCCC